jgi:phosphatidylserine decarboxylase
MRIAPEGWPFIVPAWALVALAAWGAGVWGRWMWVGEGLLLLFAVWLIVFFRDPRRIGPRGDQFLLAPADGRIVEIAVVQEPMYLKDEATRISTFMNVLNVHVNRYPVSGEIALVHHNPGKFLHAATEKASLENEQASVGIQGPQGGVLVRQIAGLLARRIVTDARAGARAVQGERLGMIRFGSRVDLLIPRTSHFRLRVAVGDQVRTGTSVLGEYLP